MRVFSQSSQTVATRLVSLVIISVLCLQLYASFLSRLTVMRQIPLLGRMYSVAIWPFLDHPMFRLARYPGDRLDRHYLFGILEDSTEVPIPAGDIPYWQFRVLLNRVAEGDSEKLAEFVERWQRQHQRRLQGLRLENHPLVFTGSAIEEGPREIVSDVSLAVPTEPRP